MFIYTTNNVPFGDILLTKTFLIAHMILHKNLQALGLSGKEAKIYLAVLELGEASIVALVKKSGIKRTTAYDVIGSLQEKGLVTLTKNKKSVRYLAEDPRVLEHRIEEKKTGIPRYVAGTACYYKFN